MIATNRRWLSVLLVTILGLTVLGAPPALAAVIYQVDENHDAGWHQQAIVDAICGSGAPTGGQTFEAGPIGLPTQERPAGTPPEGTGSLEFRTGSTGATVQRFRNNRYAGEAIADIADLSYWTYVDPESDPIDLGGFQAAVTIVLQISETGDGNNLNRLTFEPAYQGTVARGQWQYWNATGPQSRWYLGNDQSVVNMKPLDQWTFGGKATIVNESPGLGGVILSAGCGTPEPWADFVGNTDEVVVRFDGDPDITVYDMEPSIPGGAEHLDCEPETDVNPAGSSHTITCTATNAAGAPANGTEVVAEITGANDPDGDTPTSPDLRCTTDTEGECTTMRHGPGGSYTTPRAGTTTYRAWIDEDDDDHTTEADLDEGQDESSEPGTIPEGDDGDNTDVIAKSWIASRLDCVEETVTLPPNSANTVTCTATDASGAAVAGTFIDMEATGVNDPDGFSSNSLFSPDFSCQTGADGKCPMTHGPGGKGTTATSGRTTYRAWIDADNGDSSHEADTAEGRDHLSSPGTRSEPDNTDVVEANWSTTASTPTPGSTCFTPSPVPSGSPSPTPSGTPCPTQSPTPTPTPTTSTSASPSPSPTGPPDDRLTSGPCKGYLPDSRQPRPGGGEVIVGTPGADELGGSEGGDLICGLGGDDVIRGKRGDDTTIGGRGSDTLFGGNGKDVLRGGPGRDALHGGRGADQLFGGAGKDRCAGGPGQNRLRSCE